jgi:hypothetical protein
MIAETWARPGEPINTRCDHHPHVPVFRPETCRFDTVEQIRAKFPSYNSTCSLCKQRVRLWASSEHRRALDEWKPPAPVEDASCD